MLYFFASDKKDTSKLSDKLDGSYQAVPEAHLWPRSDNRAQKVVFSSLRNVWATLMPVRAVQAPHSN